jgi:hypothetical protein
MEPWKQSERDGVKKPPPAAALGDILRRLPDMASLQSAALVCKSWGRVAVRPYLTTITKCSSVYNVPHHLEPTAEILSYRLVVMLNYCH